MKHFLLLINFLCLFSLTTLAAPADVTNEASIIAKNFLLATSSGGDLNTEERWNSLKNDLLNYSTTEVVNSLLDSATNKTFNLSLLKIMFLSNASQTMVFLPTRTPTLLTEANEGDSFNFVFTPYKSDNQIEVFVTCKMETSSIVFVSTTSPKCIVNKLTVPIGI